MLLLLASRVRRPLSSFSVADLSKWQFSSRTASRFSRAAISSRAVSSTTTALAKKRGIVRKMSARMMRSLSRQEKKKK